MLLVLLYCLRSHGKAHIQPKEMPFCLARLMTIWVLGGGGKDGMQDGEGVSRWKQNLRNSNTWARQKRAYTSLLLKTLSSDRSSRRRHLHARCTFLDPHELSSERGKAPTAGCRSEWSFSQSPTITFCMRQSQHLCTRGTAHPIALQCSRISAPCRCLASSSPRQCTPPSH